MSERSPFPRGDRFLAAFRSIEHVMRSESASRPETHFAELVRQSRNRVVKRFENDLLELAELRNAIVHRRNDRLLAEPTEEATRQLEELRDVLAGPPRLDNAIGTRRVEMRSPGDSVRAAARTMRDGNFSQLPIYDKGQFVALLTAETVARWVAAELERHDGIHESRRECV
jgi:hypothetical protein